RVREIDGAAGHRRAGGGYRRHGLDRRPGGERRAAQGPRHRDGVPELRALPAHERGAEPGVRAPAAQDTEIRDRPAGRGGGPRAGEVAGMVGMEAYLGRRPAARAGGKGRRVGMGRAIIREPQAFLMDEPLSNLDAKLRVSMRASLSQLHERLGVTTVYVTHDQVEAMTLGDRVCVLREGKLQQADTPQVLFNAPVNLFVAGFIGSPAMNFVTAKLVRDNGPAVTFAGLRLPVPEAMLTSRPGLDSYFDRELILGIRPSDFEDASLADPGWARIPVTAGVTEDLGSEIHVLFSIDAPQVQHHSITQAGAEEDDDAAIPLAGGKSLWTARVAARSTVRSGQAAELAVDTSNLQFFDADSGLAIGRGGAAVN